MWEFYVEPPPEGDTKRTPEYGGAVRMLLLLGEPYRHAGHGVVGDLSWC